MKHSRLSRPRPCDRAARRGRWSIRGSRSSASPCGSCARRCAPVRRLRPAVLRPEALHRRPGLDQRAVDREVLVREQRLDLRQPQKRGKELPRHLGLEQPVAIVREHRRMPDRAHRASGRRTSGTAGCSPSAPSASARSAPRRRPAATAPAAASRARSKAGRSTSTARRSARQRRQSLIRQPADRPQRVIRRNALLQRHVGEQPICPIVPPAHAKSPPWLRSRNHRQSHQSRLFQQPAKAR